MHAKPNSLPIILEHGRTSLREQPGAAPSRFCMRSLPAQT